MFKKTLLLGLVAAILFSFCACGSRRQTETTENGKIRVTVTFNALKEFAQAVGKDKVQVTTMIPDGTEPHDFEPKARDLEILSSSKIFVYNGLGMEKWADETIKAVDNKELIAVDASKGAVPIQSQKTSPLQEHGQYDPHLWISLKGAEIEAKNIRDALIRSAPADKDYFETNYSSFVSELEKLYTEYSARFQSVSNKSFVTGHAAFAYLCRDFGLTQNSVEDVFAEGEPSAQKLSSLVDFCKKYHVTTVFVEEMVSPAVSQTLANQVGAKVKTIYTMESSEDNKSFLERMKLNLQEIDESLSNQ